MVQHLLPLDSASAWIEVRDGDPSVRSVFDRHYSRRAKRASAIPHPNHAKFMGPGEHMVLRTVACDAIFAWRVERFRQDGQEGVNCAVFRNEGRRRSSDLIREAVRLAWERWPDERLFTFVDPRKIRSTNPGACFKAAGWSRCGTSKKGLVILAILPD